MSSCQVGEVCKPSIILWTGLLKRPFMIQYDLTDIVSPQQMSSLQAILWCRLSTIRPLPLQEPSFDPSALHTLTQHQDVLHCDKLHLGYGKWKLLESSMVMYGIRMYGLDWSGVQSFCFRLWVAGARLRAGRAVPEEQWTSRKVCLQELLPMTGQMNIVWIVWLRLLVWLFDCLVHAIFA